MVAAVGAVPKKTVRKHEPCRCTVGEKRIVDVSARGAMTHHVVGRRCDKKVPLNCRRRGCVGSIGECQSGSCWAAATAGVVFEEVLKAKKRPVKYSIFWERTLLVATRVRP